MTGRIVFCVLVLCCLSTACAIGSSVTTLRDFDDFWLGSPHEMYWLDDEHLIFMGFRREAGRAPSTDQDKSVAPKQNVSLYILDVRTGLAQAYIEDAYGRLCYSRGYIVYGKRREDGKTFAIWAGQFGQERESQELTEQLIGKSRGLGKMACRYLDEEFSKKRANQALHRIVQLYPEHGYIEYVFTPMNLSNRPILFHKAAQGEPVEIQGYKADKVINLMNGWVDFFPFKGAYFMWSFKEAWWLYPDGTTEPQSLPRGPWDACERTCVFFTPTKAGMFVNYLARGSEQLLLVQGNNVRTIATRRPEVLSKLSPNGCRVAFNYRNVSKPQTKEWSLAVADVCAKSTSDG